MLSGAAAVSQTTDANNYFTPYSIFGVGNIAKQGTTFNKSMGGIGIGVKENRIINYLNPAAISFRDTLAFMLDFGVESNHNYFRSEEASSANNGFNMHNFVFSFPIYKKSAMVMGITPYSSVGYKFQEWEKDPEIINELGSVVYSRYGTGGILFDHRRGGAQPARRARRPVPPHLRDARDRAGRDRADRVTVAPDHRGTGRGARHGAPHPA